MLSLRKTLPYVFIKDESKLNALLTTLFYELSSTTLPPKSLFQGTSDFMAYAAEEKKKLCLK